jgi:transposase
LADALGRPLRFILTPGQAHDLTQAHALLEGQTTRRVIADRGYDSNGFRSLVASLGAKAVVPAKSTRITIIRHDAKAYRLRNRIERCFNKLKHFRRIATRYDRRDAHFLAALHLAGALQWLPA